MGLRYRTQQFLRIFWDKPSKAGQQLAHDHLPENLQPLFERMSPSDQAHSIRVCQTLLDQGYDDPELMTAALLHDVGKSVAPPRVWERVLIVLANQIMPERVLKWSEGEARGLRRAFVIAHKHPEWGADLVAQSGGSKTAEALIRYHQVKSGSSPSEELAEQLMLLQAADSAN